jgi:hypothetical protein
MKTTLLAFLALLSFSYLAAAASVDGKWTAEVPGRNGNATNTFTFKSSGDKLEGTVTTQRGENPISEGKIDGDKISFVQNLSTPNGDFKITYSGVVKGDTIEFTREMGGRGSTNFTAKKAQ